MRIAPSKPENQAGETKLGSEVVCLPGARGRDRPPPLPNVFKIVLVKSLNPVRF